MGIIVANRKIHEYLKSRKSWNSYKKIVMNSGKKKSIILLYLLGGLKERSYSSAFSWSSTEQGFDYWALESYKLQEWYTKNRKSIEKCDIYI